MYMYSIQASILKEQSQIIEIKQRTTKQQRDTGKTKNLYVQLPINKQGHDDIGNFHFHDEALKAADLIFT